MTFPVPEGITPDPSIHGVPPQLQPTGPASGQVEAWRSQFIELILRQVLLAFVGFFVPGLSTFEQLQDWADSIGLGDLLEILTGIPDADNNDLGSWVNNLFHRSDNAVPILMPAASVVNVSPNLLMSGDFAGTSSIVAGLGWSRDAASGHLTPGSAKLIADGTLTELVSNQVPVVAGQQLDLSIFAQWQSLVYTGTNPIAMGVTQYLNGAEVASSDEAFIASPASDSSWVELSKTAYVVPAGCDEIRLRLKIGANLTSGTVWWDDGSIFKTDLVKDEVLPGVRTIIDNIVNGLENSAGSAFGHPESFTALLNQMLTTVGLGSRLLALESQATAGVLVYDNFDRIDLDDLGPNWEITYTGPGTGIWSIALGFNADFTEGLFSFSTCSFIARYIGTGATSSTDNQKISMVMGDRPQFDVFTQGVNDLYGRMSSDRQNFIRLRVYANGFVEIAKCVSGVVTVTASGSVLGPGPGSTVSLVCGTAADPRLYKALLNGAVVFEWDETDTGSQLGPGFRGWGHGGVAEGSILVGGQSSPASLASWGAIDYPD